MSEKITISDKEMQELIKEYLNLKLSGVFTAQYIVEKLLDPIVDFANIYYGTIEEKNIDPKDQVSETSPLVEFLKERNLFSAQLVFAIQEAMRVQSSISFLDKLE